MTRHRAHGLAAFFLVAVLLACANDATACWGMEKPPQPPETWYTVDLLPMVTLRPPWYSVELGRKEYLPANVLPMVTLRPPWYTVDLGGKGYTIDRGILPVPVQP
jgi:hypothetical protein